MLLLGSCRGCQYLQHLPFEYGQSLICAVHALHGIIVTFRIHFVSEGL